MTEFFQEHWQAILYITIAVLPSLITGFRQYPQVAHWLSVLLDVLSVVQHKDSPGTFKAPFKRSTPPEDCDPVRLRPPLPPAAVLVFGALAIMAVNGCCKGPQCKQTVLTCAKEEIKAQVPHLLPVLADLCMHGAADLENEIAQLSLSLGTYGWDIVRCAMEQYEQQSAATLKMATGPGPDDVYRGHARAAQWLAAHPVPR